MAPKTFSVIAVLLLGAVSMTNSLPLALSRQESVQNNHFRRPFPQSVYPQETVQKSIPHIDVKPALASEMVYGQTYPQQSVRDEKPIPAPEMVYGQAYPQQSVRDVKPIPAPEMVYGQAYPQQSVQNVKSAWFRPLQ